ncbi:MAG TPA: hypothetical protein VKH45_12355 [Candidatus Acidoferrum sp.]|nr:hypothetical protein [Candidatus Acidoferrum sp.]
MKNLYPVRHRSQKGYALMVIMFLLALMAISVAVAASNAITSARREQEQEMIWRGKQYVRGIRLYYTKMHKFPTELEDLYKPKTGLRFMRQAYKDPMNTKDGSWRMIYVGPNGMLIGSLKNRATNAVGQATSAFGSATGSVPGSSSMFGSANGFGSASSFGSGNNPAAANNSNPTTPTGAQPTATNLNGQAGPTDDPNSLDPQSLQAANLSDGTIIGGNIIGVGSKINKKSIIWYEKAKNYLQFEFVWDPSVDPLTGARSTMQTPNANPLGVPGNAPPAPSPSDPSGSNSQFHNPTGQPSDPNPQPQPPLQAPPNP